jgi:hypothetical protein
MEEQHARPDDPPLPASTLHRMLIRLRIPRFMADHAAALLAVNLRKRDDRGR